MGASYSKAPEIATLHYHAMVDALPDARFVGKTLVITGTTSGTGQYRDAILDQVRGALEIADSPQAFLLLHSLGGGTGSGLGSYILEALRDDAPELYRLSTAVLPSGADDVITSPYNALLSLWKLTDAADVVVPFENAALMGIVDTVDRAVSGRARLVPASCITFVGPPPAAPHLLDVRPLAPAPRAIKLPPQLAPLSARVERVGITGREVATKSTKVRGADFVAHGSAVRHVSDVASSTVDVRAGLEARHRTVVVRSTAATARGSAVARASLLGDSRVAGSGRGALHVERDLEDDKQDGGIDVMFPREESVRNDGDIKLLSRVTARRGTAWDSVNNIGALAIAHLTASMRFEGPHNVDLNEIATTLVPFPRLHFLTTGLAPLYIKADDAAAAYSGARARRIDALFTDATSRPAQLVQGDPRRVAPLLAAGFLLRGSDVAISDAQRNMRRMRRELPMAAWNPDGFKLGLCSQPSVHAPDAASLLYLANSVAIADTLSEARARAARLFRVHAHLHHYTQYIEVAEFLAADEAVADVVASYDEVASRGPDGSRGSIDG